MTARKVKIHAGPIHTGDTVRVDVDALHPHPKNPRMGNVPAIGESLAKLGQYRPIVVNHGTHTGRPDEIVAGHHLVLAARQLGWPQVSAIYIDVDEETASKIMLADNRTSEMGDFNDRLLSELLTGLNDLSGTAYNQDDLNDLLTTLEKQQLPEPFDVGEPEEDNAFSPERKDTWDNSARRIMVLDFPAEQFVWAQQAFGQVMTEQSLESNVGAVLWLLAAHIGEEPPPIPTADPPAVVPV